LGLTAVWMVIGLVPMSPNTTPSAPPKLQRKTGRSGLGSFRPKLRTPASAGHPSQSSSGRDTHGACLCCQWFDVRGHRVGPSDWFERASVWPHRHQVSGSSMVHVAGGEEGSI